MDPIAPEQLPGDEVPVETEPIPVIDPQPVKEAMRGSTGSVVAILLIVLLLVIGAFYVWGQRLSEKRAQQLEAAQQ